MTVWSRKLTICLFPSISGVGIIFGATGGITEAAVRRVVEDKSPKVLKEIEFIGVRGMEGVKNCELTLGERQVRRKSPDGNFVQ